MLPTPDLSIVSVPLAAPAPRRMDCNMSLPLTKLRYASELDGEVGSSSLTPRHGLQLPRRLPTTELIKNRLHAPH